MSTFEGKVAVVTGAGSGIGRALALGLAARGARLALSDVNESGMAATADLAKAAGVKVHTATVDVADREAVGEWARETVDHFGVIHQVYNNAGIGSSALSILDADYAAFDRVLAVNLWGVIHGTKEFLPHVIASRDGHVVNVSSLNGFMAQSNLAPYCASKFGVRGFTEVLRAEMLAAGQPVGVTLVHPGGIQTNITQNSYQQSGLDPDVAVRLRARGEKYAKTQFKTTADEAAKKILDGVAHNKPRVLIAQATWVDRIVRALPSSYPRLVARWEKRSAI